MSTESSGAGHAPSAASLIADAPLDRARDAVSDLAVRTPLLASEELDQLAGGTVLLKAECLQRSGSFKLRGALSKLAALGPAAAGGLVTASAGNHGRAVAYAARAKGVSCVVFMPRDAAVPKVDAARALGATVHLEGDSVDEALALAAEHAATSGAALVHPFDDLDVIAGQATLALELLEDVPQIARVLVPVGGGGLASGVGIALRRAGVRAQLIGVQAQVCAPYAHELGERAMSGVAPANDDGEPPLVPGATIADGIAIKRPGTLTLPLLRELLDGVQTVGEDEIADAMVLLADGAKLVAEGAGAVAVAALLGGRLPPVAGVTVAIVSGGNVDSGLLSGVLRRRETAEGRRVRIFTRVPDRPGGLAELLLVIAGTRANVIGVEHLREAVPLHVRETGLELTLQTRGPAHTAEVLAALRDAAYEASVG